MIEVFLLTCILVAVVCCVVWPSPRVTSGGFSLRVWWVYFSAVTVATGGILLCSAIAATVHRDNATRTHCGVFNFWPSVSAAIGNNNPEIFLWRLAVGLHNVLVMLDPLVFYQCFVHMQPTVRSAVVVARLWGLFKALSAASLFVLTFVSSTDNFLIHEVGFIGWVIFGSFTLLLLGFQLRPSSSRPASPRGQFAWRWVKTCIIVYFTSLIGCAITSELFFLISCFSLFISSFVRYYVHNEYCTPMVYSLFGLFETATIIAYVFGVGCGHVVAFCDRDCAIEIKF
jgi:hypothetical protein